jgi:phosphate transport system substrate-binding protein
MALAAFAALLPCSCAEDDGPVTIQGCGATFPAPLYKRWFLEFYKKNPNVRVNYQAIGSGAGIRQFTDARVDFGASDEPKSEKDIKKIAETLKCDVLQVPMTAGAIALCYNLPGNPKIRLSRTAYPKIVVGQIAFWDHEEIRETNPDVKLPHLRIEFIRRAESSGTTFNFTNHLQAIDKVHWGPDKQNPDKLKAGKTIDWPVGVGGKGTAGVSALIQQTPGALGYIEAGYANLAGLPIAALENRSGNFVLPEKENEKDPDSAALALEGAKLDKVNGGSIPDPAGKEAYPIVTFTWIICRKSYPDRRVAEAMKDVLLYCLGDGQSLSPELHYIPLPYQLNEDMRAVVGKIHSKGD